MEVPGKKICAICGEESKYCCPACSTRTCSLKCVKVHKEEKQCSGVKDKTTFVDANEFDNSNLLSDYRFLEEGAKTVDNAGRHRRKMGLYRMLPVHLFKLRKQAGFRKIRLEILPLPFSRRKVNTTYLRYLDNVIFWRIEWQFPQIEMTFYDESVDEKITINQCLDKYLLPEKSDLEVQEKLSYFQALGHKGVHVLLKKEDAPANDLKYYVLNKNKSLKKSLRNKKIIEYPTFIVIGTEHVHIYNLVNDE